MMAGLEATSGPHGRQEAAQGGEHPHSWGTRAGRRGSPQSQLRGLLRGGDLLGPPGGWTESPGVDSDDPRHTVPACVRGTPPRTEPVTPVTTLRGSEPPAWGPGRQSMQGALLCVHSSSRLSQQTAVRAACLGLGTGENCPKLSMQEEDPKSEPPATIRRPAGGRVKPRIHVETQRPRADIEA